jgi:hypothetical protein
MFALAPDLTTDAGSFVWGGAQILPKLSVGIHFGPKFHFAFARWLAANGFGNIQKPSIIEPPQKRL